MEFLGVEGGRWLLVISEERKKCSVVFGKEDAAAWWDAV